MVKFSANLGFLWADLPLPEAIRAAKRAGFDAVECHWPYDVDPAEVRAALQETGLPMLGLNTVLGDPAAGEFGLTALVDRAEDALAAIDQAITYAAKTGTSNIHVMAGKAAGIEAEAAFITALKTGCDRAQAYGLTLLIEPINDHDVPGYFLTTPDQAAAIIDQVGAPNLAMMFDCYHVARMGLDVIAELDKHLPRIGHIQFAGVPNRGRPDQGTLNYKVVFQHLRQRGYNAPLGAEYRPQGETEASLAWMQTLV
ncbi:hydroxypyruvate isomerase family protein [Thalassovita mediterranea]|jgi:hydroxypyruvate isomerase|uniref:Hydroxypyruvate isomerase n=1 Tax=Thalassovita mediterranea TaxID=340021 RepID=A0A0P1HBI9_9RHOB|nr:TIM barrel protein [Thalassovita mediterranea]CUH84185.1 Hydroxypyruvate isomerase [Thalassovita mediterranea]SIS27594.1 hydroxypyruvate isomerase [Thalassovita mediterranea]